MRRVSTWVVVALVTVPVVGFGAGGWYYSDQLLPAPPPSAPVYDVEVLASDESAGWIELGTTRGDLVELATVGLVTPDGSVVLDGVPQIGEESAVREGRLLGGTWPRVGERVAASVDTFDGDPANTLGVPFEEIDIAGPAGRLPAWRVVPNGAPDHGAWVVLVHGRGATLTQGNRALLVANELDLPTLSISVRNAPDAAADPDGYGRYGEVEWEDLQAAIDHLRAVEGAQRFVLIGYSQGASIALGFLRRSPDAHTVGGAVLISPLVSLHETLALQAGNRDIPELLIPGLLVATRLVTAVRADMDFSEVEHLDRVDELPDDIPLLVTHGTADDTVPVGPTRALAATRPAQVRYEEYDGVGHVREWNADRERFETDLAGFLEQILQPPTD